jgi:CRP-like cAMP-binding protein
VETKMEDQYNQLQKFIAAIHPLPEDVMDALMSIWQPAIAKRKVILTRIGEKESNLYFITEGIQRVYYFDEQNREATIVFTYPFSFGGVADSFLTQTPSRFFAETLTPSSFLKTSFQQLNELMQKHHSIEHAIRIATNYALAGLLERMIEIQCFTAEEKFKALMKRSPHILNLVPHKYIANYLGIDATNFSKLLAKVRI